MCVCVCACVCAYICVCVHKNSNTKYINRNQIHTNAVFADGLEVGVRTVRVYSGGVYLISIQCISYFYLAHITIGVFHINSCIL